MANRCRQMRFVVCLILSAIYMVLHAGVSELLTWCTSIEWKARQPKRRPWMSSPMPITRSGRTHVPRMQGPADSANMVNKHDRLQVLYDGTWYDSIILEVSADGTTCTVKYDARDKEDEDVDISTRVRAIPTPLKVEEGQRMEVLSAGTWHDCEILQVSNSGDTCTVKYNDSGYDEPDVAVSERIRMPRIKLDALEDGQKFKGEVKSITGFGFFVDIGAEKNGLVHISRITDKRIENVEDYVRIGQMVDVWVSQVLPGKLGLTMIESEPEHGGGTRTPADKSAFLSVSPDEWLNGIVVQILNFGVFVTVAPPDGSAPQKGLVHITEIKEGFVHDIEDEVQVGEKVKVRVLRVDENANKLSLSMRERGTLRGDARRPSSDFAAFKGVSPSEWLTATVGKLVPYGIFVTVKAPDGISEARGLVHVSKIRDGFVENLQDEVEVGEEVKVRVLELDVGSGRMDLSMKEDSF